MLDTNQVSDMARDPYGPVAQKVLQAGVDTVVTSIIVAAEIRSGLAKRGAFARTKIVEQILAAMRVHPFDTPADKHYAEIRVHLEAAGEVIGGNDLLIAAHARALGLTLVTANQREFERVPGLAVENWTG